MSDRFKTVIGVFWILVFGSLYFMLPSPYDGPIVKEKERSPAPYCKNAVLYFIEDDKMTYAQSLGGDNPHVSAYECPANFCVRHVIMIYWSRDKNIIRHTCRGI